jgi:hypothetical protein
MKQFRPKRLALTMSILLLGVASMPAETKEPGPFEKLFRAMRRAFTEPQQKSTRRSNRKQTNETTAATTKDSANKESNVGSAPAAAGGAGAVGVVGAPPNESNTRSATRAVSKKGEDLPYGTPIPGKQGFVTSPFSPNSGYIDVRGFAPGTPVKDPYTGKIFLTP